MTAARVSRAGVLYDADCPVCRLSMALLLAWDRRGVLRPVALQDPEALLLLGTMDAQAMSSWHLVDEGGAIRSAGAAAPPLLRRLPGGAPLAALTAAAPRVTERLYRLVSHNRSRIGPLIPGPADRWARRTIAARSAPSS